MCCWGQILEVKFDDWYKEIVKKVYCFDIYVQVVKVLIVEGKVLLVDFFEFVIEIGFKLL